MQRVATSTARAAAEQVKQQPGMHPQRRRLVKGLPLNSSFCDRTTMTNAAQIAILSFSCLDAESVSVGGHAPVDGLGLPATPVVLKA
jgi:hypothetical protein